MPLPSSPWHCRRSNRRNRHSGRQCRYPQRSDPDELDCQRAGDITIAASDTVTLSGPTSEISTGTFALDPDILRWKYLTQRRQRDSRRPGKDLSAAVQARAGQGKACGIMATDSVTISGLAGIASQAFAQNAGTVEISAQA